MEYYLRLAYFSYFDPASHLHHPTGHYCHGGAVAPVYYPKTLMIKTA